MKEILIKLSVLFLVIITTMCSTDYNEMIRDSETVFYNGNHKEAARKLISYINDEGKEQLLLLMECGMMLHVSGEYETSNRVFLKAAKIADTISTSITKQTAALLLNETMTNYKGEDFERVLVHMYLGINFLMLNNFESARVEFKKVDELLRDINVTTGKKYKQNILAKYLTAIAFELVADIDQDENDREFAYIEYKQIHKLSPKLSFVHRDLQRLSKQLGDMEDYNKWKAKFGKKYRLNKNTGELIVIYHAGRGAVKVSRGSLLSDVSMKNGISASFSGMPLKSGVTLVGVLLALKIAEHPIPKFKKRSNNITHLVVNINGKDSGRTYMLENIENTAVKNMEDNYKRMYLKVAAGISVKAIASVSAALIAKKIAEQTNGGKGFAGIVGAIVGLGTGAALASQIKPDLRCWHTLPANMQIGRIFLSPGKYNVTIKFMNKKSGVEKTEETSIEIAKGKKTFLNYRTLN